MAEGIRFLNLPYFTTCIYILYIYNYCFVIGAFILRRLFKEFLWWLYIANAGIKFE